MGKQDQILLFYPFPDRTCSPLVRSSVTGKQTGAAYYITTKQDPNSTQKIWITISLSIKEKYSTTET